MRIPIVERPKTFFRGILRTSRGSVILVAVENMPIAPTGALTVATNAAYDHPAKAQERGAGVGQSIWLGQYFDGSDSLNYLQARYENPGQGQFISQDPMFLGNQSQQTLIDPQSLNAYSYSEDSPIVKSDPSGKCDDPFTFLICAAEVYDAYQAGKDAVNAVQVTYNPSATQAQRNSAYGQVGADVAMFASGEELSKNAEQALDLLNAAASLMDQYSGGALKNNKKMEGSDNSTSNQIQLSVGGQGNGNSSFNNYVSANPVMGTVFQPSTKTPNAMGVVYNQNVGSGQVGGGGSSLYQQLNTLVGLLNQLQTLLQSIIQTSNSNQSNNKK